MVDSGNELELEVSFGGFSCGDQTARLGFHVERARMNLEQADAYLCGARLEVKLRACEKGDAGGQKHLDGMEADISSVADCKQFGAKPEEITAGLTFAKTPELVAALSQLAKRPGKLYITRIGDTSSDADDDDDGELPHPDVEAGKDRPHGHPTLFTAAKETKRREKDAGYRFKVSDLTKVKLKAIAKKAGQPYGDEGITDKNVEALESALEVKNVAGLEKVIATDAWWHKKVSGFGEERVSKLTDALVLFRRCHPVPSDEEVESEPEASTEKQSDPVQDAYREGCEARVRNENRNPFTVGSQEAEAWVRGWEATGPDAGTMLDDEHTEETDEDLEPVAEGELA